jgi:hypothetical protein
VAPGRAAARIRHAGPCVRVPAGAAARGAGAGSTACCGSVTASSGR